jgi:hypothetical protein
MRGAPSWNRALRAMAVLCGLGLAANDARAREPEAAGSTTHESARQPVFAIMGEVARPGAFELPLSQPQLLDLVNLAGGATAGASGNVRVIRGGRPGWQTCLTPGVTFPLRPNDLVIVDAVQSRTNRRFSNARNAPETGNGSGTARPASEFVQLGIVQLISRPVVLDLTRDQATVKSVLSFLHQPLRDRATVTVVKPVGGIEVFERDQPQDIALASGSVLIFDPATVNAAVLPQLPPTMALAAVGTTLAASPASIPEPVPEAPPGEPIPATVLAEPGERPEFVPRKLPATHTAPARAGSRPPRRVGGDAAAPQESPRLKGLLAVGAILSSAILLLWLRRNRTLERIAKRAARRVLGIRLWLERVLPDAQKATEKTEPSPQEPDATEYRLQEPVYRIDAAQSWNGPFLPIDEPAAPKRRPRPKFETRARALPTIRPGRKVRIDGGHLPGGTGAIDRALAALDGERPSRS